MSISLNEEWAFWIILVYLFLSAIVLLVVNVSMLEKNRKLVYFTNIIGTVMTVFAILKWIGGSVMCYGDGGVHGLNNMMDQLFEVLAAMIIGYTLSTILLIITTKIKKALFYKQEQTEKGKV